MSATACRAPHQQLRGPHGLDDLMIPDGPPELREFLIHITEDANFQRARNEREQVHMLRRWGADQLPKGISMQQIASFLGTEKTNVQYHLSRPFDFFAGSAPGRIGRPPLLNAEQEEATLTLVTERFALRNPVGYEDIREFLLEKFQLVVDIESLYQYLGRHTGMRTVIGQPMEDSRAFASTAEIEDYFTRITEIVTVGEIPSAFVCNIDESGFDTYVDTSQRTCIVPTTYELNTIPVPVTRREKRATLLAGIVADGTALKPMVVLPRVTLDEELLLLGYTPDRFHYGYSPTGFMNKHLFAEWIHYSFIPEMDARRTRFGYEGPILLLMDGFGVHHSDDIIEELEEKNIIAVFIPPHTSDQLQPCDLGIFANQKRWQKNVSLPKRVSRQSGQVIRMLDAWQMATTAKNITNAFRKSGIDCLYDQSSMRLMAQIRPEAATSVRRLWADIEVIQENAARRRIQIV